MINQSNYAPLNEKLQLLEEIQQLIDQRAFELPDNPVPDVAKCSEAEWRAYKERSEWLRGQAEGLNQAWLLIQRAAVKLKYPNYQPYIPAENG